VAVSTRPQPNTRTTTSRRLFPLDMTRRGTIPQLPALDGLRGIAVLLVIAYHLGWMSVPGGFLGVEVFFVVSGYLITSLIVAELDDNGFLDLAGFWARRLRRLLPALLLLIGTLALIAPLVASDGVSRLRSDLPASLLYLANWWQIFGSRSYFEASVAPDLLQHLWSLAIEEQFYVVWPPIVAALYTRLGRRRWVLPLISASGAALSVVLMARLFDPDRDPSRVYYGTDTRASALLIGATVAFVWQPDLTKRLVNPPPVVVDCAGVFAGFALALAVARYNGFDPAVYQGGFLLVSAATALLIVAGTTSRTLSSALLSHRVLRAIGERSYGLYLWHWPIFQMTRPGIDVALDGWRLTALRLGLLAVAAEASWRLVERPLRRPRMSARGQAARRYRRAELTLAISLPLLLVPYVLRGSSTGSALDTSAFPSSTSVAPATEVDQPADRSSSAPTTTGAPVATVSVSSTTEVTSSTDTATTTAPDAAPAGPLAPATGEAPSTGDDVLVVGDSVMLGATPALQQRLPAVDIDAVVGRQLRDAADVVADLHQAGRLRRVVVVHLGNNGSATPDQLDRLLGELDGVEHIVLVTANAPRPWRDAVNERLGELATDHPNVQVLDWHAVVEHEDGLIGSDGVHLTTLGAERLAELVSTAVSGT
jgi:peptidoglycan/LPS O-acetylase OafA/YrhL